MFSRKKPAAKPPGAAPAMRGRDNKGGDRHGAETAPNPLARRFQADSEPDTIDLADPGRFHSPGAEPEPETSGAGQQPAQSDEPAAVSPHRHAVISLDPATGKFYVHPGADGIAVLLGGQAVAAATELRRGDRIQVGETEFEFLP